MLTGTSLWAVDMITPQLHVHTAHHKKLSRPGKESRARAKESVRPCRDRIVYVEGWGARLKAATCEAEQ